MNKRAFYFLYRILTFVLFPILVVYMVYRLFIGKETTKSFMQKFGIMYPKNSFSGSTIWIHAVSLGELNIALSVIKLFKEKNFIITTSSISSADFFNEKKFNNVKHVFFPIDTAFSTNKFLKHWAPSAAFFIESEIWPQIILNTSKKIPIFLLNGRISEKTNLRWRFFFVFAKYIFGSFSRIFPATNSDCDKFKKFGLKNLEFLGNFKYCAKKLYYSRKYVSLLKNKLTNRNIWVAASTHPGEEDMLLRVHKNLKEKIPNILLIIIPRHIDRAKSINLSIKKNNFELASNIKFYNEKTDVLFINSIGVLGDFFALSDIVFIGGTFVNVGGHNILEPARFKSAILIGPYFDNFREIVMEFQREKSIIVAQDIEELEVQLRKLFENSVLCNKISENAYRSVKKRFDNISKAIIRYFNLLSF